MKVVPFKSIKNVDNERLLDSRQQLHYTLHDPQGIHESELGHRKRAMEAGLKLLAIIQELTNRRVSDAKCCNKIRR